MTERLYYTDAYLRDFTAQIVDASPDALTVYLDRTAFYPTSGGQPFDLGAIAGDRRLDVIDEDDRIAHRLARPLAAACSAACSIDWSRRFDHMQQHTGQHLLSAVFEEQFGLKTVSFHLSAESSTIDLEGAAADAHVLRRSKCAPTKSSGKTGPWPSCSNMRPKRRACASRRSARVFCVSFPSTASTAAPAAARTSAPPANRRGALRKSEKIRQATRVEFRCGARAIRRARADYEALAKTAQMFSMPFDESPPPSPRSSKLCAPPKNPPQTGAGTGGVSGPRTLRRRRTRSGWPPPRLAPPRRRPNRRSSRYRPSLHRAAQGALRGPPWPIPRPSCWLFPRTPA